MADQDYFMTLRRLMDQYAHEVYALSKSFPANELYGITSQLRRSALSVILNFIEGYARIRPAVKLNFWEISYGSLKESKYLLHFCLVEQYVAHHEYKKVINLADEIGAMLWPAIQSLSKSK
ncbi:MAG: four helix bundle protein [Candidatus Doudnabacteria bacterium]|nr:four helix bundle protein [Candidatus Doudnabacteria bacterium]